MTFLTIDVSIYVSICSGYVGPAPAPGPAGDNDPPARAECVRAHSGRRACRASDHSVRAVETCFPGEIATALYRDFMERWHSPGLPQVFL